MEFKTRASPVIFSLFLVDIDKKYRNEKEMDKNNSVTYMEYIYFKVRVSRTQRKSLPNFQVQIQKIKIHDMLYVIDWKTHASSVLVSLIPG